MNKIISLFALAGIALTSSLMASEPLNPDGLLLKRVPTPAPGSLLKQLKDMEANGVCIDSILNNENTKTTIDKLKAPIVLNSMEDALKHLSRESMKKIDVDFEIYNVVIFAWQGSGQDRLSGRFSRRKGAAAVFSYNPGRTEDLRTHSAIYSMPKGTQIKVFEEHVIHCDGILKKN